MNEEPERFSFVGDELKGSLYDTVTSGEYVRAEDHDRLGARVAELEKAAWAAIEVAATCPTADDGLVRIARLLGKAVRR